MQLPDFILSALPMPQRHSIDFTQKVRQYGSELSETVQAPFQLSGSDYCAGLCLRFDVQQKKVEFEIRIYFSTKSPLYAFYLFGDKKNTVTVSTRRPNFVEIESSSQGVQDWINLARSKLDSFELREVPQKYFFEPAPNCFTELDDLPSDVFQALFAEIL
jgi:hypothetical protein